LYVDANSIRRLTTERSEAHRREAWAEAKRTKPIYLTKDQMFYERTKHIDIKYHYVRYVVAQGKLQVCKISTHNNPADMMTKPVPVAKFELCSSLVGITV
jgi:hypothetical protein